MLTNKEIVNYLSSAHSHAGFLDKLKIRYRPFICPFDVLLSYAKEKKTALDIGCGSGQFCALLAKFTNVSKIKGIEINERLISNANALIASLDEKKKILFETFDGKTLPEDMDQYELVYLIDVLHHVPKRQQEDFIKEIYLKMGSGATLVFKDINAAHPFVIFNKLHDLLFAGEIGSEMKAIQASGLLAKYGFVIKEQFTKTVAVYPHYFFICVKP